MQLFYCASSNGFYDSSYECIPEDKIEISEEEHAYLLTGFQIGKVISVVNGRPVLVVPALDEEQLYLRERVWRDAELKSSDIELFKVQDSANDATGTVGDWRSYRNKLRDWPQSEGFPSIENRPKFKE